MTDSPKMLFSVPQALELALAHHGAGRLAEAEKLYREIIRTEPGDPNAFYLLGVSRGQAGDYSEAIDLVSRAISIVPHEHFIIYLAEFYRLEAKPDEQIRTLREGVRLYPQSIEMLNRLGIALTTERTLDEALSHLQLALSLNPNHAQTHFNLATAYKNAKNFALAADHYRATSKLRPDLNDARVGLGICLGHIGREEEAIPIFEEALRLNPNDAEAHANLAVAKTELGAFDEALVHAERANVLNPDDFTSEWNRALLHLTNGRFDEGWPLFERRIRRQSARFSPSATRPYWNGESLHGKTILLHVAEGLGDVIQFARYIPEVAKFGGRMIIAAQWELARLFKTSFESEQIQIVPHPVPNYDYHCSLLSLSMLLWGRSKERLPQQAYLKPPDDLREKWANRLKEAGAGSIRVGIVWAGNSAHGRDRYRSSRLEHFALLARTGIQFFSLQKGPPSVQAKTPPPDLNLIDWTSEIDDFADTAGLVANLDLVIAVDTSTAHLAGAMGKPVWLMVPSVPDWRWLRECEDSIWYPTMRLFRQAVRGDWSDVIQRMAQALEDFRKPL